MKTIRMGHLTDGLETLFQKAVFYLIRGGLLGFKKWPIGGQKVTF